MCEILEYGIEALNPKFHVEVVVQDGPTFYDQIYTRKHAMWISQWTADFPDAHNFAQPYLYSEGFYGYGQGLTKYDSLVEAGLNTLESDVRQAIYYNLQQLAYEDAVDIFVIQDVANHVERTWLKGWYRFIQIGRAHV